jgi:hypothetical protein
MRLSRRQLIGAGLGLGTVAAGAAAAALLNDDGTGARRLRESRVATGARFPGDAGPGRLFYGASLMPGLSLSALETSLDHRLTLKRSYFDATEVDALVRQATADHAAARLPVVSTKLPSSWAEAASGAEDSWLLDLLDRLGALTKPTMLALHHEPENNADSGPGMASSDWVALQQRAISAAAGKPITILPVLMSWTFLPQSGRNAADWWVQGAPVMGIDCYNPWSSTNGAPWSTFEQRMTPVRRFAPDQPLVVPEYGCRTPRDDASRAGSWMVDAFEYAHANDVTGLAYFDSSLNSPDGSWVLDDVRTQAMRDCIGQPQVVQLPS